MSTASDGRRREYKVRHDMESAGWLFTTRAAGSKGPVDLWMRHPVRGGACVQVKSGRRGLTPSERELFLEVAEDFHALPILARVVPRSPIEYTLLSRNLTQWERWTP